jgi:type IV pilus assembly protein PilC
MPKYRYQLRTQSGAVTAGEVLANNIHDAAALLRGQGHVMDITPIEAAGNFLEKLRKLSINFGPSVKDVLSFTSQLSVMIKAGISIRAAVEGVADQIDNPKFKRIVLQIRQDVDSGKPFSEALARYPRVFSPLYVNMVRASEMSGSFGHMLERIAGYLRQQVETRSMVRGAMVYPIIIGTMAIVVTVFLLTFVLPRFTTLFAGKESLLPRPTVLLLALSHFMRTYWYLLLAGLGAAVAGFLYVLSRPRGRKIWDMVKLKFPVLSTMFRALYITRGLQTMGEMVTAGVPMLETLQITGEVSGNVHFKAMWQDVYNSVKAGKKIAAPLVRYTLMPKNVVQMISAGEESGKLSEVLRDVSDFYSNELRNTIKAVTAMIEPLMIVMMGFVVGFIAMSVILPIFKLSSLVKG